MAIFHVCDLFTLRLIFFAASIFSNRLEPFFCWLSLFVNPNQLSICTHFSLNLNLSNTYSMKIVELYWLW